MGISIFYDKPEPNEPDQKRVGLGQANQVYQLFYLANQRKKIRKDTEARSNKKRETRRHTQTTHSPPEPSSRLGNRSEKHTNIQRLHEADLGNVQDGGARRNANEA